VLADNTSLWIAQYTSADQPSWPAGTWPTWSLWQWTDSESIEGISAPVDGDRWNGDDEGLLAWFGPAEEQPAPEPIRPGRSHVDVALKTEGRVTVSVTVNGEVLLAQALADHRVSSR
jgi:hypothetical protein